MSLDYQIASFSVQGRRERIEDSFHLDVRKGFFMVADGVAGTQHGQEASAKAVCLLKEKMSNGRSSSPEETVARLRKALYESSYDLRRFFSGKGTGATTITAMYLYPEHIVYGQVGDSRLYVLSAAAPTDFLGRRRQLSSTPFRFTPLTVDSLSFLGQSACVISTNIYEFKTEDCGFLLCTDGLYRHLAPPARFRHTPLFRECGSQEGLEALMLSRNFGKALWRREERKFSLQYERQPKSEVDLLEPCCRDAADNVTAIYALFQGKEIIL